MYIRQEVGGWWMVYLGGLASRNGNRIGEQIQARTDTKQRVSGKTTHRAFYSRAINITLYVILIPWTNVLIVSCCIGSEEVIRYFAFDTIALQLYVPEVCFTLNKRKYIRYITFSP